MATLERRQALQKAGDLYLICLPPTFCHSGPAFGSALKSQPFQGPPVAPARCISSRGFMAGKGNFPPLEETTSAAHGVGRDSSTEGVAVGCPVSAFNATVG